MCTADLSASNRGRDAGIHLRHDDMVEPRLVPLCIGNDPSLGGLLNRLNVRVEMDTVGRYGLRDGIDIASTVRADQWAEHLALRRIHSRSTVESKPLWSIPHL